MNSLLRKIQLSLRIDYAWVTQPGIPGPWNYIFWKYVFLAFPYLFWDKKSHSYRIPLFGQNVHIPTIEHIAFLQGTFTDHGYLQNYVKQSAVVVDIGAHAGEFALVCKTLLQAKQVYSFEPVARIYKLLTLNTKFKTYHGAVGTKKEQIIYVTKNTVTSSGIQTSPEDIPENTPSLSPDSITEIAALPSIDLLKIDVEGMEYDVLLASKETIQKSSYISLEISLNRPASKIGMETLALLKQSIPTIELIHIGTIFPSRVPKQVAVDMLFHNPTPTNI